VVEHALTLGCEVTTFRRGQTGEDIAGVDIVRGDRAVPADLERLAAAGPWDLVVDTSGYVPREQLAIARALEPTAARLVFISSVSAYVGWPVEPLTEASPVLDCPPDAGPDYGYDGDPGPTTYGFTKAGCERAVLEVFGPDRTTVLRPGVILGPHEYVGRLPWWLRRVQRGGRILAPGSPDRSIQPVDVRDVAAFALAAPSGTFNVTGPHSTMGELLRACAAAVHVEVDATWVTDEPWLLSQGIEQWTGLPLWRTWRGTWQVSSQAAMDAGLSRRPLRATAEDTWRWMTGTAAAAERPAGGGATTAADAELQRAADHGVALDLEAAVLGLWDARELDRCG
jgi:nucleoside-diphosphate-sugar epimerase